MRSQRASRPTGIGDRARFVWLWVRGMSAGTIAQETGTSVTTVYRWLRRWRRHGSIDSVPRSGRPRITSREEDAAIVHTAKSLSLLTLDEIKRTLQLKCSSKTILRRLQENSLSCCQPVSSASRLWLNDINQNVPIYQENYSTVKRYEFVRRNENKYFPLTKFYPSNVISSYMIPSLRF